MYIIKRETIHYFSSKISLFEGSLFYRLIQVQVKADRKNFIKFVVCVIIEVAQENVSE